MFGDWWHHRTSSDQQIGNNLTGDELELTFPTTKILHSRASLAAEKGFQCAQMTRRPKIRYIPMS